jgi:acetylornithine/N-succinyldiaminopimelate aminotransferase
VIYPVRRYLEAIRQKCSDKGALLIFDEAQTGFGRLGSMFALEKFNVIPDILVLAKALGGGMPLGAFIASKEIMSSLVLNPGLGHITTFGGHPVCCAAGLASLEVIIEEDLIFVCKEKSDLFRKELVHPLIREIRGDGLLMAVELIKPELIHYIIAHAPEHGLILDYFLFCDNAFRIAPPLIITNDEVRLACGLIKELLNDASNNIE